MRKTASETRQLGVLWGSADEAFVKDVTATQYAGGFLLQRHPGARGNPRAAGPRGFSNRGFFVQKGNPDR